MAKTDHLSKIRDALDEFIGDEVPGTIEIDRPGKTDMVVITKEAFEHLVQVEARLNEIEEEPQGDADHDAMIAALTSAKN
tara:strand:+ start:1720 stop:1959 length:240 start_codon:yes stop_codon:yes gene_type:complete